ncbi:4Fe-4S binding domain-containing protein [Ruminococcaceae bacterium P7]|nr:4Fe-4S binding domain-containing protein [Ruminococcaceae bacterium P7]
MKNENTNTSGKSKIPPIAIARAAVQLVAFILVPGLFISVFSALGAIWKSILSSTFRFDEQAANILLLAVVFIVTAVWGRFFCGFICSFGALQDLLWLGGRNLPFRPVFSQKVDRVLKYLKYAVLLFIVIGVWTFGITGDTVWSPWTIFGMYASPWKGVPSQAMFLSVGGLLLLLTIIGSLLIERFFCKYLCPLGALFTLASHFRVFKLKRDSASCSGSCRVCSRKCSMSIPLYQYDKVRSGECIDCMKCTTACARGNINAEPVAAVSGTLAAAAIAGVSFVGTLPIISTSSAVSADPNESATAAIETATQAGKFKNGSYVGYGTGFRGSIEVTVLVSDGAISEIAVNHSSDDSEFFAQAEQKVIPAIIAAQDTNVATVSGATFSSQGIIDAVADALGTQLTAAAVTETKQPSTAAAAEPTTEVTEETTQSSQSNGTFTDGVYSGSGTGFRGTTDVSVTVEGGKIADITINSYQDDEQFFSRAQSGVISEILAAQDTNVATVSGATFSSNSIIEAVSNALGKEFTNPNSTMSRGHGHGHSH